MNPVQSPQQMYRVIPRSSMDSPMASSQEGHPGQVPRDTLSMRPAGVYVGRGGQISPQPQPVMYYEGYGRAPPQQFSPYGGGYPRQPMGAMTGGYGPRPGYGMDGRGQPPSPGVPRHESFEDMMKRLSKLVQEHDDYVSVDVECVATQWRHTNRLIASVAVIDGNCRKVVDVCVLPPPGVVVYSYLTELTGLTEKNFAEGSGAVTFQEMRIMLKEFITPKTLVIGQNVRHDIGWLKLERGVDFAESFDIANMFAYNHPHYPTPTMFSLKHEVKLLLKDEEDVESFQEGQHGADEDALMTMKLFLKYKDDVKEGAMGGELNEARGRLWYGEPTPTFSRLHPLLDGVCMGGKRCPCSQLDSPPVLPLRIREQYMAMQQQQQQQQQSPTFDRRVPPQQQPYTHYSPPVPPSGPRVQPHADPPSPGVHNDGIVNHRGRGGARRAMRGGHGFGRDYGRSEEGNGRRRGRRRGRGGRGRYQGRRGGRQYRGGRE